jgi:hypothetical protein
VRAAQGVAEKEKRFSLSRSRLTARMGGRKALLPPAIDSLSNSAAAC